MAMRLFMMIWARRACLNWLLAAVQLRRYLTFQLASLGKLPAGGASSARSRSLRVSAPQREP
eukprot:2955660-Pyramimonas_sp.AAC.1